MTLAFTKSGYETNLPLMWLKWAAYQTCAFPEQADYYGQSKPVFYPLERESTRDACQYLVLRQENGQEKSQIAYDKRYTDVAKLSELPNELEI